MDEIDREAFVVAGFAERTIEHKQEILRLKAIIDNASACSCDPDVGHVCENHYPEWAAHKIRQLEADNTALRARAVPDLEWEDFPLSEGEDGPTARALPGAFKIRIYCVDGRFTWRIRVPGADLAYCGAVDAPVTLAEAKAQCRATFLRLVGVK